MPLSIGAVCAVQYLLAATFVVIPAIACRYGRSAQRAAEAEIVTQGFPAGVLAKHRVRFEESAREAVFPLAIAAVLVALASLNLAGADIGRVLTWVFAPILLIGGGLVTAGQLFPARFTRAAFARSPELRDVDVRALMDVAAAAFPAVLRPLQIARFVLVTVGSLLVMVALSTPSAGAWFS